jgi:hypothetical protein
MKPKPENDPSSPDSWAGIVYWLLSNKKRILFAILACLVAGALLVGVGRLLGYDVFASVFPKLAKVKVNGYSDAKLQFCIDEAQRRGKAYVILAATETVEIVDSMHLQKTYRIANVRNVYTLLLLRDISKQGNTEFFESFSSDNRAKIDRWFGTERETSDGMGSSYDVLFDAKKGETKTVVTGATYTFPIPLPANRSAFDQSTSLGPNEDTWGYPNVVDGDFIREITIVLWSPTTRLIPVGQAAKRLTNRVVSEGDVVTNEAPEGKDFSQRSISAQWSNLVPGEEVGIQFRW